MLVAWVNWSDAHIEHAWDVDQLDVGSNDAQFVHFFLISLSLSTFRVKASEPDLDIVA